MHCLAQFLHDAGIDNQAIQRVADLTYGEFLPLDRLSSNAFNVSVKRNGRCPEVGCLLRVKLGSLNPACRQLVAIVTKHGARTHGDELIHLHRLK